MINESYNMTPKLTRIFYWQILYIPHFHGNTFEFDHIEQFYLNHQTLESESSSKKERFKLKTGVVVSPVEVPTERRWILFSFGTLYPASRKSLDSLDGKRIRKRRFRKQRPASMSQILEINFLDT